MNGDKDYSLPVGSVLKGPAYRYKITKVLGSGSFGITYLATIFLEGGLGTLESTMQVAIKEFFMRDVSSRDASGSVTGSSAGGMVSRYGKKFQKESENLARMHHKGIVKVLEAFEANSTYYYSMEYYPGGNLDDCIIRCGGLDESAALRYIREIADALSYMHSRKMLHLDLKPKNIMLSSTGSLRLIDFGLSKQYDERGEPESSTTVGYGTPGYAPVEQGAQDSGVDFAPTLDVYALGATLYKMLTGETPPKASIVLNDGLSLDELRAKGVSPNTQSAIVAAMQPRRKDRPQSVEAFLKLLNGNNKAQQEKNNEAIDEETITGTVVNDDETEKKQKNEGSIPHPKPQPFKRNLFVMVIAALLIGFSTYLIVSAAQRKITAESGTNGNIDNTNKQFTVNGVTFTMVSVQGGTFTMSATAEQGSDAYDSEKPAHQVTLDSYYMGETEVTQALWQAVMGSNPSYFKGDNLPVENVTWEDCQEFIRELNRLTGRKFRLPTEAEWEYAARGGRRSQDCKYSGSNSIGKVAWYTDNSGSETHAVKGKQPNELGLYDMSGNVWEWCADWYGSYSSSSQNNPKGASTGSCRVLRGGGGDDNARDCRVSDRSYLIPAIRSSYGGLRLALR